MPILGSVQTFSRADRIIACTVALASVLMIAGIRYAFTRPPRTPWTMASTDLPHLP
jgi:hypothetical protein